jgi:chromosome segregation ATPase
MQQQHGKPSIRQAGMRSGGGLTISAQRVKGKGTSLPAISSSSAEVQELRKQVAELAAELEQSRQRQQATSEAAAAESARAGSLAKRLLAEEQRVGEARQSVAKALSEEEAARSEAMELTKRLAQAEQELGRLRAECEQLRESQASASAAAAAVSEPPAPPCEGCAQLGAQVRAAEARAQEATARAVSSAQEAAAQEAAAGRVEELEAQLRGRDERLSEAEARCQQLELELEGRAGADAEAAAAAAESGEKARAKLQAELESAAYKLEQSESELSKSSAQLKASTNQCAELKIRLEMEKEHVPQAAEINLLRDKVRRAEELLQGRDRAHREDMLALQRQLDGPSSTHPLTGWLLAAAREHPTGCLTGTARHAHTRRLACHFPPSLTLSRDCLVSQVTECLRGG